MKKFLLPLLAAMLSALLCFGAAASETVEIKMTIGENVGYVNGEAKTLDAAPIIRGNRTMLPVRFVAENLGAQVAWDPTTSTAILTTDEVVINITIGASTATVNGESVALDAPAFIESSRTYLPVRFVAESLGATVSWDGETSTATITLGDVFVPFPDDYTLAYPDFFDYASTDLTKYVKLGEYKNQTFTCELPLEVSDEEVEEYANELVNQIPEPAEVTDRAAENGDIVIIDFVGKIDDVAFDGGSAENYELTLGDGLFIDGFEDGIVGMKVGETKAVETVFPADYTSADLAGKTAVFEITLNEIYELIYPKLTDEYVKENSTYETVAELKAAAKAELDEVRANEIEQEKATCAMSALYESSEVIAFPEGLVEDHMYEQLNIVKLSAAQYGMTYETLLSYSGYTVEAFEAELRAEVEAALESILVTMAVANAEDLGASEQELAKHAEQFSKEYGYASAEELFASGEMTEAYFNNFYNFYISAANVVTFLVENNTFKN